MRKPAFRAIRGAQRALGADLDDPIDDKSVLAGGQARLERFDGDGFSLSLHRPGPLRVQLDPTAHLIDLHLGAVPGETRVVNGSESQWTNPGYRMIFIPAGFASLVESQRSGDSLMLQIAPTRFDIATAEVSDRQALRWQKLAGVDDVAAILLGRVARHYFDCGRPAGRQYLQWLVNTLAVRAALALAATDEAKVLPSRAFLPRLQQAVSYVEGRLDATLTLKLVAAQVGLSPHHFGRLFKQAMGCTLHEYVIERRLLKASVLLREANDPIADIAYVCGFSSQAHLTTLFRRHYGTTPQQWRQREPGPEAQGQ